MFEIAQAGLVFVGGGIGAVLRYGAGVAAKTAILGTFPWGTLLVNVIGSIAIGLVAGLSMRWGWSESTRIFLVVGVLGGFTTFSAFSMDNVQLIQAGAYGQAALNIVVQVVLGIVLAFAGLVLTSPTA